MWNRSVPWWIYFVIEVVKFPQYEEDKSVKVSFILINTSYFSCCCCTVTQKNTWRQKFTLLQYHEQRCCNTSYSNWKKNVLLKQRFQQAIFCFSMQKTEFKNRAIFCLSVMEFIRKFQHGIVASPGSLKCQRSWRKYFLQQQLLQQCEDSAKKESKVFYKNLFSVLQLKTDNDFQIQSSLWNII